MLNGATRAALVNVLTSPFDGSGSSGWLNVSEVEPPFEPLLGFSAVEPPFEPLLDLSVEEQPTKRAIQKTNESVIAAARKRNPVLLKNPPHGIFVISSPLVSIAAFDEADSAHC
jgi:hypothetical protein